MENLVCLRETVSSPPRMVPLSFVIILPIFIFVLQFFPLSYLKQFYYSRCLSDKAATEFEKVIPFLTPGLLYVCTEYRVIIVLALLRLTLLLKVQHHSVPSSILLPPWEGKQWIRQGLFLRIICRLEPSSTKIGNEAAFFHTRSLPFSLQGQSDSL